MLNTNDNRQNTNDCIQQYKHTTHNTQPIQHTSQKHATYNIQHIQRTTYSTLTGNKHGMQHTNTTMHTYKLQHTTHKRTHGEIQSRMAKQKQTSKCIIHKSSHNTVVLTRMGEYAKRQYKRRHAKHKYRGHDTTHTMTQLQYAIQNPAYKRQPHTSQ